MLRETVLSLAATSFILAGVGCHTTPKGPRTAGDREVLEGKLRQEKGELMKDGEDTVAKAQGMKAEGEALTRQGKVVEGDRMVRKAEIMLAEGRAKMDQAKAMRTEVAPTTMQMTK